MCTEKKVIVIIAAAGSGNRMGSGIPKQYRMLKDKPVLVRTLQAFSSHPQIDQIYLVVPESHVTYCRNLIDSYAIEKVEKIIEGGKERQDSVFFALKQMDEDIGYVLVHDGARPLVSEGLISSVVEQTKLYGATAAAVPVKDTIKYVEEGTFTHTPKREQLYAVQTPQGFEKKLLKSAYEEAYREKICGTDDAVLVEKMGKKVYLVEGEYNNIKITTGEDMMIAEAMLSESHKMDFEIDFRVGNGFDVHRFSENRKLILGGVDIPFERGLLGHSDADVLLHAIMDALLGAAALGDIGKHFPDQDATYSGISSLKLLERVGEMVKVKGFVIGNIDGTVIAQRPKISPYIEQMRTNISSTLQIDNELVNVKGTTTEKLGFAGREEGIGAQASVLLRRRNSI